MECRQFRRALTEHLLFRDRVAPIDALGLAVEALEALEALEDQNDLEDVRAAREEARQQETIPHAEVMRRLGKS